MMYKTQAPRIAKTMLIAGCWALLVLTGCEGGTLIGGQHSCTSNFGLLEQKEVSCTGSVDTVRGSPSLSVIEIGDNLDGAFRLEVAMEVGQGTAKAHVTDNDDKQVGGEVSPGEPLEISVVVYPESRAGAGDDEERVDVQLEVAEGEEVRELSYEATLVRQE